VEPFIKAVMALGDFSQHHIDLLWAKVAVKEVSRDHLLLKKGQMCSALWFVNRGAFRLYRVNEEGIEETLQLCTAGDWLLDYESFTGRKPSKGFIKAYEESEVVELDVYALHSLIQHSPLFFKLGKVLEKGMSPFDLHATPEQKYRALLAQRPDLVQTFPLQYIASYLAIAPETLSRIRRRVCLQSK
jgi:CRP-like cAMP-binding protein